MKKPIVKADELDAQYQSIFGDVSSIIDEARQTAAKDWPLTSQNVSDVDFPFELFGR